MKYARVNQCGIVKCHVVSITKQTTDPLAFDFRRCGNGDPVSTETNLSYTMIKNVTIILLGRNEAVGDTPVGKRIEQ